jgi:hypothetical protein
VLSNQIVFSELWESPEVSVEQMEAWREAAAVSRDVTEGFTAPLAVMERYPHDEHYGGYAETELPLLLLQGTWDPATRPGPAEAVHRAFEAPNHHWVEIPRGAHGALGTLPTTSGELCGSRIVHAFLDDPTRAPDVSCLEELAPLTFDGEPALNDLLFGTEEAWGGG